MDAFLTSKRVIPVHFIGDSNALIFHDLLVEPLPGESAPTILRTSYCTGVQAARFMSDDGKLEPSVSYALFANGILLGDPGSWNRERREAILTDFARRIEAAGEHWDPAGDTTFTSPVAVFCIGIFDCWAILKKLGENADFHFESERFSRIEKTPAEGRDNVPASLVRELIERTFAPLFRGLEAIRDSGVRELFLHDLQPPSLDMDEFARVAGPFPIELRYKLTLAINERLERFCREARIGFIDIWDDVTASNGLIDQRCVLDFGHLNRRAAAFTLQRLFSLLRDGRGFHTAVE